MLRENLPQNFPSSFSAFVEFNTKMLEHDDFGFEGQLFSPNSYLYHFKPLAKRALKSLNL